MTVLTVLTIIDRFDTFRTFLTLLGGWEALFQAGFPHYTPREASIYTQGG